MQQNTEEKGKMGCAGYGPLLSRYVDEDLGTEELENLLEHLTGCVSCQKALTDLESLRSWFQTADAFDAAPEAREALDLERLLGGEAVPKAEDTGRARIPTEAPKSETKRAGKRRRGFLHILNPFPAQNAWRYAFAMIALVALGIWFYPGQSVERIDVHKLTPMKTFTAKNLTRQESLGHNMDLYVLQHASNQPWGHYGDELPMIRQVSGSIP